MLAKGKNGQVEIVGDRVRISRKGALGFMTQGFKGEKEIAITDVSSIQFKTAGWATRGYIQFAFTGGTENKRGLLSAASDENTVMFNKKQQPEFENVKQEIETLRSSLRSGAGATAAPSAADELKKFADLKDQGIITESEFEAKKADLLS